MQTDRQTGRQAGRQAGGQTDRQAGGQTDRQAGGQTEGKMWRGGRRRVGERRERGTDTLTDGNYEY